jgi:hypothetical protein
MTSISRVLSLGVVIILALPGLPGASADKHRDGCHGQDASPW